LAIIRLDKPVNITRKSCYISKNTAWLKSLKWITLK
jgi:hypothetical protein